MGEEKLSISYNPRDSSQGYKAFKRTVIARLEKEFLEWLLVLNKGSVSLSAKYLKTDRSNLHRLLRKHGLKSFYIIPETKRAQGDQEPQAQENCINDKLTMEQVLD